MNDSRYFNLHAYFKVVGLFDGEDGYSMVTMDNYTLEEILQEGGECSMEVLAGRLADSWRVPHSRVVPITREAYEEWLAKRKDGEDGICDD